MLAAEVVASIRAHWPATRETIADASLVAALEQHFAAVPLMQGR